MRKYAFLLSRLSDQTTDELNSGLLKELPANLLSSGYQRFSINLFDAAVAPAKSLRLQHQAPPIEAVLFAWSDSRDGEAAQQPLSITELLAPYATVLTAYSLEEHSQLPVTASVAAANENFAAGIRTPGMMQLAFLKVPSRLNYQQWLKIWREQHTQIAIDIQSTFIYRQNVVLNCLTDNDLGYTAIVEEAFPVAAMTSQHAFYAASSDEELAERQTQMWNSSQRFIDLPDLDVLPTSEYCWYN